MATDRQIEANRRNAERSTGPKTEAGKAQSRANATKHGLAGESASIEAGRSAEFETRRREWSAELQAEGSFAGWALDKVVGASLRIDRCERAMDALVVSCQRRAELAWDQDRAVEAAEIAARLPWDPVLASRKLKTTRAGVALMVEKWFGLLEILKTGRDWSELEAWMALDLLGVDPELRVGRTRIDDPQRGDPLVYRRTLAVAEIGRLLESGQDRLIELEGLAKLQAMEGDVAVLSRPAKLVLRYEREAWRRLPLVAPRNPEPGLDRSGSRRRPERPVAEAIPADRDGNPRSLGIGRER